MRTKGYTIIELLIVTTLLSLLMALLSPVLARAKRNAQEARCLSQLRQVHLGFQLAADNSTDGNIEEIQMQQAARYVPVALRRCSLASRADIEEGADDSWQEIQRVSRPTSSEMGRVTPDSPFLQDAAHHHLYKGPWLIITASGSARSILSPCRPWFEKNAAGDYLYCDDLKPGKNARTE